MVGEIFWDLHARNIKRDHPPWLEKIWYNINHGFPQAFKSRTFFVSKIELWYFSSTQPWSEFCTQCFNIISLQIFGQNSQNFSWLLPEISDIRGDQPKFKKPVYSHKLSSIFETYWKIPLSYQVIQTYNDGGTLHHSF